MCLYPKLIKNPKYKKNKKNGGVIPAVNDTRVLYVPIGCQKCMECRKQKANMWRTRLLEDIKTNKNGLFVTLTFSNESITELYRQIPKELEGYDVDNAIAILATRRFLERWRKTYKKSLRHWLVTELGQNNTEHLHMHGIIWTNEHMKEVQKHWKYGYTWPRPEYKYINYVNEATVNYITKYVNKADKLHPNYIPVILTTAGIGANYINSINAQQNKFNGKDTNELYRCRDGTKTTIPIYWRNKLYNDKEKEELWLHKLDKEERWINGEKVSIQNGDQAYYKLLAWHRAKNNKLGYGNDEQSWEQEQYEKMKRNLKIQERIKK